MAAESQRGAQELVMMFSVHCTADSTALKLLLLYYLMSRLLGLQACSSVAVNCLRCFETSFEKGLRTGKDIQHKQVSHSPEIVQCCTAQRTIEYSTEYY